MARRAAEHRLDERRDQDLDQIADHRLFAEVEEQLHPPFVRRSHPMRDHRIDQALPPAEVVLHRRSVPLSGGLLHRLRRHRRQPTLRRQPLRRLMHSNRVRDVLNGARGSP